MSKNIGTVVVVLLASAAAPGMNAQTRLSGPAQIEARAAERKLIQEQLADRFAEGRGCLSRDCEIRRHD